VIHEKNAALRDLKPREWALLVPVIALCVVMGVFPNLFLKPMEPSVQRMLGRLLGAPIRIQAAARPERPALSAPAAQAMSRDR
jgi:NADH:ubiquinone oxidoreductase subunit 4 (subunit M)